MKQISGGMFHGTMECEHCGFTCEKHWLHSSMHEDSFCPECGKK